MIAPPISSTNADRVVVRRVRPPGRTAGRRPTSSSRSASLLLFHRRASSLEPPRRQRARAEPRARRALIARRRPRRANTDRVASGAACAVLAFHHRVYLPNRISLAEVHSDVRARRYVKSVADVQRGNRSGLIGSSRFPLRSAPLRSAPLRSASLCVARFALNREQLSLLIAPRSLFSWLGHEVATRDALSHLQPQPGTPGYWGPAAGEVVTRVGFRNVIPMHNSKRPRVPRAVPSFSEHRNSVLLRCAALRYAERHFYSLV